MEKNPEKEIEGDIERDTERKSEKDSDSDSDDDPLRYISDVLTPPLQEIQDQQTNIDNSITIGGHRTSENKEQRQSNQGQNKLPAKQKMPSNFFKARRQIDAIVNSFFDGIKMQYAKRNKRARRDLTINDRYLVEIKRNLRGYLNLDYPLTVKIKGIELPDPIYVYAPEMNYLLECNANEQSTIKKIELSEEYSIPEMGTPVPYQDRVYVFDGGEFDFDHKVFKPFQNSISIDTKTGNIDIVPSPSHQRIKCGVVRNHQYVYLLGGYITQKKYKTSTCERFNLTTQSWESLPSLNNRYTMLSGFVFNDEIYVMGDKGIEKLQKNKWIQIEKPYNFSYFSFPHIQQINKRQVLIAGGWNGFNRLDEVLIYNPLKNLIRTTVMRLPCRISNEKISGGMIVQGSLNFLSPICYNVDNEFGYKSGAYELVSIGTETTLKDVIVI